MMKKWLSLWPEWLLLLACAILLTVTIGGKKGYHQDELLCFEFANAEFNPWIVPTQPQGRLAKFVEREIRGESFGQTIGNLWNEAVDVLKNRGSSKLLTYQADVYEEPVWIDRQTFVDYLTVDGHDAFQYASVYFNVKDDNHPPLYFMLVHTVSSIFQNKINPYMGCLINLCFVLGIMALLMRLGRICLALMGHKEQGRIAGLGAAAIYGLSAGALSSTLLIRMYAALTFFCVWLLLEHVEKLWNKELIADGMLKGTRSGFDKKNKRLILITALGFWTQYFFLFFCFALAAVTAVLLLRQKRTKELVRYIVSMITAAVIGLAVFPFAIGDVFSSGRGVEALQNLQSGLGGYFVRIKAFLEIVGKECGMICVFTLLLICLSHGILSLRKKKQNTGLVAVLLIPLITYFLLAAKLSPFLVDRYVMPVFPVLILVLVTIAVNCLTELLKERTKKLSWILAGLMAVLALIQPFSEGHWDNDYLYPEYETQEALARENEDLPCICIYEGVRYYENLPEFMQYEKTLLLTVNELEDRKDTASIAELDRVAVLLKNKEWTDTVDNAMKTYGFKGAKTAFSSASEGGDLLLIYEKEE